MTEAQKQLWEEGSRVACTLRRGRAKPAKCCTMNHTHIHTRTHAHNTESYNLLPMLAVALSSAGFQACRISGHLPRLPLKTYPCQRSALIVLAIPQESSCLRACGPFKISRVAI